MEQLFTPHAGLMVWTTLVFLCLVFVLARFAWKPILKAIAIREEGIRNDIQAAESSRRSAERSQAEYERKLAEVEARARELLSRAEAEARGLKEDMRRATESENAKLLESSRLKLAEEERRLARELREEMADLSLRATEKMLRRGLDKSFQDRLVKEALADFELWAGQP